MDDMRERRNGHTHEQVEGLVITDPIRDRLSQAPHALIALPEGIVRVVYGKERLEEGSAVHVVFCRTEFIYGDGVSIREEVASAATRNDAIASLTRGIPQLIRTHEAQQRQKREDEKRLKRESRVVEQSSSRFTGFRWPYRLKSEDF